MSQMNSMFSQFDPSKMDPSKIQAMTQMMQRLAPHDLLKLQTLSHNMMAGFDVKKEIEEFEKTLPLEFRMEMFALLMGEPAPQKLDPQPTEKVTETVVEASTTSSSEMSIAEARMTILRGVGMGHITAEAAYPLLFP